MSVNDGGAGPRRTGATPSSPLRTPAIDARLDSIIRAGPHTSLTEWDILHILRSARSVFFDTHVEVVSGHHTATYLRFESIARYPDLIRLIADDMAAWIKQTFQHGAVTGTAGNDLGGPNPGDRQCGPASRSIAAARDIDSLQLRDRTDRNRHQDWSR